jgi:hypothetical protein
MAKTCAELRNVCRTDSTFNLGARSVAEHQGYLKYSILIANTKAKGSVFRYKHDPHGSRQNVFFISNILYHEGRINYGRIY